VKHQFALIALLAWCVAAYGQATDAAPRPFDKPFIQTSGQSQVQAKPDQAVIDIGVITKAQTAASAASYNAGKVSALTAELRKVSGGAELKTISYSVQPNYAVPKPGSAPEISGYTATNILRITLDDLGQLGKIIDTAMASGANNIQQVQFRLKNARTVRTQAMRQAATDARANAEALAAALGLHVLRVLSVEENGSSEVFRPMRAAAGAVPMVQMGSASTMIETGTIDVNAAVTLRVEIGQ
jgi:uncharacterized protein YggE